MPEVVPTVIVELELLHVPPLVLWVRVMVCPWQTEDSPLIAVRVATVIGKTALHPVVVV
jgi:hypothetical protein